MKKTRGPKSARAASDEMLPEYALDYGKARRNRFADSFQKTQKVVILDSDIAAVFTTPESVNRALRAIIAAVPRSRGRKPLPR